MNHIGEVNMSVKYTVISLKGTSLLGENPLPFYQNIVRDRKVNIHESLKEDDNTLFGYETAPRYLPYKMQDRYNRDRSEITLKAIVMENDILKATFLPEYGGRLYSLYHKQLKKDLLFTNPVIQPANLGVLNAWISGGIEWNIGQYGHCFTTCSPLFCAILKENDGEEFLRMYEYERCHNFFWHLDFHLPKGSSTLNMYVRIVNDQDIPTSMYYWSNIAVREMDKARVFSGSDEVIYLDMNSLEFGKAKMPYLPIMPDKDASFPVNFLNSSEYFFQTEKEEMSPWEAVVYPDNWMFYERSSNLLRYRKMFCWGTHTGGQRWKDYLSEEGSGDYIEIQGGVAPTQLHGMVMEPNMVLEFVQCFGGVELDATQYYNANWHKSKEDLRQFINQTITEEYIANQLVELRKYAEINPNNIVNHGSGYGALESYRRKKQNDKDIPAGFLFPPSSFTKGQASWLHLLEYGYMPDTKLETLPESFMTQQPWELLLKESLQHKNGKNWITYLHLSIMYLEQGSYEKAKDMAKASIDIAPNTLSYRNLAILSRIQGNIEDTQEFYQLALNLLANDDYLSMLVEYFNFLISIEKYNQLWDLYEGLTVKQKEEEKIYLYTVYAAIKLDKLDFVRKAFDKEYVYIREDETSLSDLWLEYHQKLEIIKQNRTLPLEEVEKLYPIPKKIDFRMI